MPEQGILPWRQRQVVHYCFGFGMPLSPAFEFNLGADLAKQARYVSARSSRDSEGRVGRAGAGACRAAGRILRANLVRPARPLKSQPRADLLVPVPLQDVQHLAAQADRRADHRRSRSRSSVSNPRISWARPHRRRDLPPRRHRRDLRRRRRRHGASWSSCTSRPTAFSPNAIVAAPSGSPARGSARSSSPSASTATRRLNDEVRGIKGGFRRQMETFNALRRIRGIRPCSGMTLSRYNVGRSSGRSTPARASVPGSAATTST